MYRDKIRTCETLGWTLQKKLEHEQGMGCDSSELYMKVPKANPIFCLSFQQQLYRKQG